MGVPALVKTHCVGTCTICAYSNRHADHLPSRFLIPREKSVIVVTVIGTMRFVFKLFFRSLIEVHSWLLPWVYLKVGKSIQECFLDAT